MVGRSSTSFAVGDHVVLVVPHLLDASALHAILGVEPERRAFNEAIEAADSRVLSAAIYVEMSIVIEARHRAECVRDLELFIERAGVELVPVDGSQARVACRAFSRFGKGRHRAGPNFGDGFARALATSRGETLLFKGNDVAHTDIASART